MSLSIQSIAESADMFLSFFSKEIRSLDPGEFRSLLHGTKDARLIDVSTQEEYNALHIPGSKNYDVLSPQFIHKLEPLNRFRPFFIYCRNGKRSETARMIMEEMGFKRVYTLISGLQFWKGTLEMSY